MEVNRLQNAQVFQEAGVFIPGATTNWFLAGQADVRALFIQFVYRGAHRPADVAAAAAGGYVAAPLFQESLTEQPAKPPLAQFDSASSSAICFVARLSPTPTAAC